MNIAFISGQNNHFGVVCPDKETKWFRNREDAQAAVDKWNIASGQFTPDQFNPDALSRGDLIHWHTFLTQPNAATILFGENLNEICAIWEAYCFIKIQAMRLRKEGRITSALIYEGALNRLYDDLSHTQFKW